MASERVFFLSGIDCEPLRDQSPACGGPPDWEASRQALECYVEVCRRAGTVAGAAINLTPEAARAHAERVRELAAAGHPIAIQPNVPGFRFPRYDRDLGQYSAAEQREIIGLAKADFEAALGLSTTTYIACCGSFSEATFPLLVEHGYRQFVHSPGRFVRGRPDKTSYGALPFAHHAHPESRILVGGLDLYVIPATNHPGRIISRCNPFDPRPDSQVVEDYEEAVRETWDLALEMQASQRAPVRTLYLGCHNIPSLDPARLELAIELAKQAVAAAGLVFTPASYEEVHAYADAIGAW
jgi:hypothetical protein